MRKDKDSAYSKREAFKSFLVAPSTIEDTAPKTHSDAEEVYQQEYTEQSNDCNVCGTEVPNAIAAKKVCEFCELAACKDHLRKRRRRKNKWAKICDTCEDKFLYQAYMKLQIKAEEALTVEEQIISMKYEEMKNILQSKKERRRELSFRHDQLEDNHKEKMFQLTKEDNKLLSVSNRLESDQITCGQLQEYIERMEKKIKENYQDDYNIICEENDKLSKELNRIQKRCLQVRMAIERREKQLEQCYDDWQRKMYRKSIEIANQEQQAQKDKCSLF